MRARLCAQNTKIIVENVINKLAELRLLRGSPHRKVRTLLEAISSARASLRAVWAEHQLFSNKGTIGLLVGKLKEETQPRWYLYFTRAPYVREEAVFNEWLRIKKTAVERWQFQKTAMSWCSGRYMRQHNTSESTHQSESNNQGSVRSATINRRQHNSRACKCKRHKLSTHQQTQAPLLTLANNSSIRRTAKEFIGRGNT